MRVVPIFNMILLVGNLSIVVATLTNWRGWNIYTTATIAGLSLMALGVLFANLWTVGLKMIHASRTAAVLHDPMQVYQFTPWERVVWRYAMIPQMRHQAALGRQLDTPDPDLEARIEQLEKWEALGYIPKEDYPADLQHLYLKGGGSA